MAEKKTKNMISINHDILKDAIKKSEYSQAEVSRICGHSDSWLAVMFREHGAIEVNDLTRICTLLHIGKDDVINLEQEKPEEPSQDQTDVLKELKQINSNLVELIETFKKLTQGGEKIPISKRERATAILRKELVGKNGGGVKYEEFKRMLVQAGIGSAYASEAIAELDCHKMTGNNGITYIVTNDLVKA